MGHTELAVGEYVFHAIESLVKVSKREKNYIDGTLIYFSLTDCSYVYGGLMQRAAVISLSDGFLGSSNPSKCTNLPMPSFCLHFDNNSLTGHKNEYSEKVLCEKRCRNCKENSIYLIMIHFWFVALVGKAFIFCPSFIFLEKVVVRHLLNWCCPWWLTYSCQWGVSCCPWWLTYSCQWGVSGI